MGKRQRDWARRARLELLRLLGGKCKKCGNKFNLHIDHCKRRFWDLRKKDPSWRVSIYRKEHAEGKLQALCEHCNCSKGQPNDDPF